jgi:hypothetical protein
MSLCSASGTFATCWDRTKDIYNHARTHLSLNKDAPVSRAVPAAALRRAVPDFDPHHRLGEIRCRGESSFEARDRRGNPIGIFDSAVAAIDAVRKAFSSSHPIVGISPAKAAGLEP